eukprot:gnl/MRDRNA2_/MRDRNA2_101406_c0_seq1.p1 gnl/MRDRNA2_/MRDRNA2_101406_c0~~gnl/MRDRNA2_/MRDRNA2_101406_c0_seq1.p1  ORF type:complete len:463 (+),score=110.69 gnl/MRDRNA2_/MRDRNA2_101406_c0_seq1:52-1389(+)
MTLPTQGIHILIGGKEVATHIEELTTRADEAQKDIEALKLLKLDARLEEVHSQTGEMISSMTGLVNLPEAVAEQISDFKAAFLARITDIEGRLNKAQESRQDDELKRVLKIVEAVEDKQNDADSRINALEADHLQKQALQDFQKKVETRLTACEVIPNQFGDILGQIKTLEKRLVHMEEEQKAMLVSLETNLKALASPTEKTEIDEQVAALSNGFKQFMKEFDGVKEFQDTCTGRINQVSEDLQTLRVNQDELNERIPLLLQQFSKQNAGISELVQNMKDGQTLQSEQRAAQVELQREVEKLKEEIVGSIKSQGSTIGDQRAAQAQILKDLEALRVEQLKIREIALKEEKERGAAFAKESTLRDQAFARCQISIKEASDHIKETRTRIERCETMIRDEVKPQVAQLKDSVDNHSHELCFAGPTGPAVPGVNLLPAKAAKSESYPV